MTALENVAVPLELAGAGDAFRARRARARAGRARASGSTTIRRSSRAASSSASRSRARSRPARRSWSPTSRPAISTRPPAGRSSTCCSPACGAPAPRWCWSPMMRRWRRAATASCGCARAGRGGALGKPRLDERMSRHGRIQRARSRCTDAVVAARAPRAARRLARVSLVFIACIALGVMAIAGVGSFARSLADGLAREGRVILGGDLAFSIIHREAKRGRARISREQRHGVRPPPRMRAMARTTDGALGAGRAQSGRRRLSALRDACARP